MRFNLIFAFIWLLIAVPLLLVNALGVPIPDVPQSPQALMVGAVAAVLALYNIVRWAAARMMARRRRVPPPARKVIDGRRLEYHPEFDFSRPDDSAASTPDEPPEARASSAG